MRVLIIGATGPTGQQLVTQAAAAGHAVTALVRDAARARFASSVRKAEGDVLDPGSLAQAVAD